MKNESLSPKSRGFSPQSSSSKAAEANLIRISSKNFRLNSNKFPGSTLAETSENELKSGKSREKFPIDLTKSPKSKLKLGLNSNAESEKKQNNNNNNNSNNVNQNGNANSDITYLTSHKIILNSISRFDTAKFSNKSYGFIASYAANTNQGQVRNYNEDRVCIILNVIKPNSRKEEEWPKVSFFGIYDGHGGNKCADFLKESLHHYVCKIILTFRFSESLVSLLIP